MLNPFISGTDNSVREDKPSRYVTSYPAQLGLASGHPSVVGAMSTGDGYGHRWKKTVSSA